MLLHIFSELGPWNWMLLGFVLLAAEILVSGVFLLWIGIAALLTGAISIQLWGKDFWSWQVQVLVFLALSLISAYAGKRLMDSRRNEETDQPLLNRRAEQLVGRTARLETAIENGFGRVRLDDTIWRVSGPDMAAGAQVRIVAVKNGTLEIVAA